MSVKYTSPMERKADMPRKAYKKGCTYLVKVGKPDSVDEEAALIDFVSASSSAAAEEWYEYVKAGMAIANPKFRKSLVTAAT